jgi:hypothetical protein
LFQETNKLYVTTYNRQTANGKRQTANGNRQLAIGRTDKPLMEKFISFSSIKVNLILNEQADKICQTYGQL